MISCMLPRTVLSSFLTHRCCREHVEEHSGSFSLTSQKEGPKCLEEGKLYLLIHVSPQQPNGEELAGASGSLDPTVRYLTRWLPSGCSVLSNYAKLHLFKSLQGLQLPLWRAANYGLWVRSELPSTLSSPGILSCLHILYHFFPEVKLTLFRKYPLALYAGYRGLT